MIQTAYDSTFGKRLKYRDDITEFGITSILRNSGDLVELGKGIYKIAPHVTNSELPLFKLPMVFDYRDDLYVVVDTRNFEKANGTVSNPREVAQIINRGYFERQWIDGHDMYEPIMGGLSAIYAEWISSAIKQRYAPDALKTEFIRFFMGSFYRLRCYSPEDLKRRKKEDLELMLTRNALTNMRQPSQITSDIVKSEIFQELLDATVRQGEADLDLFLGALNRYADSPALRLDVSALMVLLVGSSWVGFAAHETVAVAIEHPPLLAYMTYRALELGIYRRTKVGIAVESAKRARIPVDKVAGIAKEALHRL